MDNLNNLLIIQTSDNKTIKANIQISNVIEYFKINSSSFENSEFIKLPNTTSQQFNKLIVFCESINYTPFELSESFCDPDKEYNKFPYKLNAVCQSLA